jgi:hypothetical protein
LELVEQWSGPGYYYCELLDAGGTVYFDLAYTFDRMAYATGTQTLMATPLANGAFTLAMRLSPPNVRCRTSWSPGAIAPEPIPGGLVATRWLFIAYGAELRLDYFIDIHTD